MERGNVLVIGNSGIGKSTLINAVLGSNVAVTGSGTAGTTEELQIYESNEVPFRIIDTVGFEPSYFKRKKAIEAVKKWSKQCADEGKQDNQINLIWFCIDGTSRKLFPDAIDSLAESTAMWKTVPIIVVITKSYSIPERAENVALVQQAFAKSKKLKGRLDLIIPVVAAVYPIDESTYVAPDGIDKLIQATNALMPQGMQAGLYDLNDFVLKRKRANARGITAVATGFAAAAGAIPVPFADAAILCPIELAAINNIASVYGIPKDDNAKQLFNTMVEAGTVGLVAKNAISALKAVPGVNLGASVINAIIAGGITAALSGSAAVAFEKIYLGEKSIADVEWVKTLVEKSLSGNFVEGATEVLEKIPAGAKIQAVVKAILDAFGGNAGNGSEGQA